MPGAEVGPGIYPAPGSGGGGGTGATGATGATGGAGPAGTILAQTTYGPATPGSYTLSNNNVLAALDTTNLTLSFVAPASGIVDVECYFDADLGLSGISANDGIAVALFDHGGTTQRGVTTNPMFSFTTTSMGAYCTSIFHLTGLTPGNTYQVDLAACSYLTGGVNAATIYVQGNTGSNGVSRMGPCIMRAVASL